MNGVLYTASFSKKIQLMHLHYQSYGSGHPLIILHGLLGSLDNWHTLGKQFAESFHTFTLDARNHGRSPHSDEFNYHVMADDAIEFMDQHRISSAFFLGHSMGGKTAMQLALTHPGCVDKLIVVDIAPRRYGGEHDEIFHALTSIDLASVSDRKTIDTILAKEVPEFAVRQFLMKNLTHDEQGNLKWKMNLKVIRKNYSGIIGEVEGSGQFVKPTLFIRGSLSNYIMRKDEPLMKKLFPNAAVMTITGVGHWVHAEAPGEFARVVLKFLRE